MSDWLVYTALLPRQSATHTVLSLCARASDILRFALIDRIGRNEDGSLRGFQRPQVASHIREIRQYLATPDAVLPNAIVIAFTAEAGVQVEVLGNGLARVSIPVGGEPAGFVVDGQQRLTALSGLAEKDFDVCVSILICAGVEELRKQFILINNTRALPKALIYELLPSVEGLPDRLSGRTSAARMVDRLNYDEESSLHGQIKQHTNPVGLLQDTVLQKIVMDSLSGGALRSFVSSSRSRFTETLDIESEAFERGFRLLSNFYAAVQQVFDDAWINQTPRSSRLVHGVGLVGTSFVMEYLHAVSGAFDTADFIPALQALEPHTAWTQGYWNFDGEELKWNSLQFLPKHYRGLGNYLVRVLKQQRRQARLAEEDCSG
ncbi:DGQHR domain-containing protein DpdB [Plasticicumulans sp.]|uniref:DGQHR domain-containing protein DpdB n=1 Tax=Plasticicumulans sp. TaxID=2307179 RepID=UPI002B934FEF|nr:DGQHR domain-containing protein DpdB [Pseudomonadales bacterium]